MTIHVTPIPRLTSLVTPAFTLGTANAAGDAITAVASNSTLLAYDVTVPAVLGTASAVGSATTAARRDHVHGGAPETILCFYNAATINNVTGDSNAYVMLFATEVTNVGDDWNGSNTFTAPADGSYRVTVRCALSGITAANDFILLTIVTSNRSHRTLWEAPNNMPVGSAAWECNALVDMDDGDELYTTIDSRGESGNVCDFIGGAVLDSAIYIEMVV